MPRLSKQEELNRISSANWMLAECGLLEIVEEGISKHFTATQYFNLAWQFYNRHLKRQAKKKKYQKKHQEYLLSYEWKRKRNARMAMDSFKCVDCGEPAQCVHHIHYKTWKFENIETDLVSLCNDCHYSRHFQS